MARQTFELKNRPVILAAESVVGTREGAGPLGKWFDVVSEDDTFGESTWEKSESRMMKMAVEGVISKAEKRTEDVDVMLCGDLLNQLMSSSFMARDTGIPFLGLYGACSTMTESLLLAAVLTDGGYCNLVLNGASSHFCSAERQFRMPLEHGNQKPLYAQSTVIGAGTMLLAGSSQESGNRVVVTHATVGKIIDTGLKDSNQMGAAMAPAAVDTIITHFRETGRTLEDYDAIVTGDLGFIGMKIAIDLLVTAGIPKELLEEKFMDCGAMIYEKETDFKGGGSGCGCSASVLAGYFYKQLKEGPLKRILVLSTGALLSTISPFQGESIPAIAHAVVLEAEGDK